ncbi:MAG: cytochrome c biogenesis protein CcsA [Betaproteobacteria bacterium]
MILASGSALTHVLAWLAAIGYLIPAVWLGLGDRPGRLVLLLGWLLHGLVLAIGLAGHAPHFGFAPALSATAWLVGAVYAIESRFYPELRLRRVLSALAAVAVLLPLLFPGAPLHPAASVWLPLHWALGIASYGLFGAAVVHAWMMGRAEDRIRQGADPESGMPLMTLERLTFRFVFAGFVLLTATLLVALVYGEILYGPGVVWRMTHKNVFSILSWLTFAALLLGRMRYGWRGRRAVRVLYAGAGLLFLAYVGSRFVMEVVLGRTP